MHVGEKKNIWKTFVISLCSIAINTSEGGKMFFSLSFSFAYECGGWLALVLTFISEYMDIDLYKCVSTTAAILLKFRKIRSNFYSFGKARGEGLKSLFTFTQKTCIKQTKLFASLIGTDFGCMLLDYN